MIQDGYVIADRLLRPALVGVAKAPSATRSPEQPGNRIDTVGLIGVFRMRPPQPARST